MKCIITKQDGFTLIETMVAMVIFTIGILALFAMQSAAINENLVANHVTTGATLAAAQVEDLIAVPYDSPLITDGGGGGNENGIGEYTSCGDLSPDDWWQTLPDAQMGKVLFQGETANQPDYFLYWAVSRDCTLIDENGVGLKDTSEFRPKHLFIAVTRDNGTGQEVTAEFSYIKQNPDY